MGADYFVLCDAPKAPKSRLGACQGSARLSSAEVRTTLLTPPRAAISQAHTSAPVRGALDWQAREVIWRRGALRPNMAGMLSAGSNLSG